MRKRKGKAPKARDAMTIPEAGARLGLGRDAAYGAARRGELPTLRFGKRLVVPIVAFQQMLAQAGRPQAEKAG